MGQKLIQAQGAGAKLNPGEGPRVAHGSREEWDRVDKAMFPNCASRRREDRRDQQSADEQ
ncbi:MAG: hypothetical protein U0W40_13305 [Acidimicrobiia bacterium]